MAEAQGTRSLTGDPSAVLSLLGRDVTGGCSGPRLHRAAGCTGPPAAPVPLLPSDSPAAGSGVSGGAGVSAPAGAVDSALGAGSLVGAGASVGCSVGSVAGSVGAVLGVTDGVPGFGSVGDEPLPSLKVVTT